MLYYFKRNNLDGSETAYITEDKSLTLRLGRRKEALRFEALSLKDVVARIKLRKPEINTLKDKRYPEAIMSKDVSLLEGYFRNTSRILKLDEYNPERVKWEEQRKKDFQKLDDLLTGKKGHYTSEVF